MEGMNLGMPEMIFIFLLALIIFGPRKLPEIGREIGKFMAEFKRASNDFKNQIESEIDQINIEEERKKLQDVSESLVQHTQEAFSINPPENAGVPQLAAETGAIAEEPKPSEPEPVVPAQLANEENLSKTLLPSGQQHAEFQMSPQVEGRNV